MSGEPDNVVVYPNALSARLPAALPEVPYSLEVEQALLGIMMMRPEAVPTVAQMVRPEHFHFADHQAIFACVEALVAAGCPPTPIAVKDYLNQPEIGARPAMAYLAGCVADVIGFDAVGHATIVRDLASRRALMAVGESLVHRARFAAPGTPGQDIVDETEQALLDVRAVVPAAHLAGQSAADGGAWMLERITGLRSGALESTAISTGILDLDRATNGGFQRGELWLIAGRPGMGKTVVMTSLSRLAARTEGVLVYQCEVTRAQQWARYLADLSYLHNRPLPFGRILAGRDLDDDEVWRIEEAAARLARLHLRLECEPSVSVAQIAFGVKAEKRRLAKAGLRLGVVFIDYLKFIKVSDRYQGQRVLEIGEISGALKQLAKAEDVCIVLLTQLNREVDKEGRADRRPGKEDLRDSGELEQDADTILLLYREAVYLEKKHRATGDPDVAAKLIDKQNHLEIILGKNRAGPPVTVAVWCDVASSTIAQTARGPV